MGHHVWPLKWLDCHYIERGLVTFAVLNLCNTYRPGNIACINSMCLHINRKVHVACDLKITVKGGLFRVTGSHIHWKSDNISETVLDGDVVTTGH